jgi:hypothetical protein
LESARVENGRFVERRLGIDRRIAERRDGTMAIAVERRLGDRRLTTRRAFDRRTDALATESGLVW